MRYEWATVGDFDVCLDTVGGDWSLEEIRARDSEVPLDDIITQAARNYFYREACNQIAERNSLDRAA